MEIVLMLLCVAGLAFAIKQVDGPFDILAKTRNLLIKTPFLGPLFFHIFSCDFCLGFWSSITVYFVAHGMNEFYFNELFIWAFGGGMLNLLLSKFISE